MEFDNSFEVPLPPDEAWKVLLDIERIAPCMPGAELTEVVDQNTYKGKIGVRLGPVALTFAGIVKFEQIDSATRTARVAAQGTDAKGRGVAIPPRASGRRLQSAGAHQSDAIGRGGAIRTRRWHHPGDRRAAHETIRRVSEGEARAGTSGHSRRRIRIAPADAAIPTHRADNRSGADGQADRGLRPDRERDLELDHRLVPPVVAATP